MARGGHPASGPPPDPNALRRDRDGGDWITLPAAGREGDPPDWPLTDPSSRERELWARLWKRPQAVKWEQNGQDDEVAMYVRALATAELPNATVAARTLVKQLQEALGISLPGLARNRWRIGEVEPERAARATPSGSTRDRFKVVKGGRGAA